MEDAKTTLERVLEYSKKSGYYYYTQDECRMAADETKKALKEFRKKNAIDVSNEFSQLRGGRG